MFARVVECGQDGALVGEETAARYAEEAKQWMVQYRGFLNHLKTLNVAGRFLEIGPGPGVLAVEVARQKPGATITGLELSADMVAVGAEYVQEAGLAGRIGFVVGDACDEATFASLGQFDLVYSTFSMHHWQDPKRVIRNMLSVLADEGVVLIHDLRRTPWLYWVPSGEGFFKSIRAAYVCREMRDMLHDLGLSRFEVWNVFPFMLSVQIWK